jgi:hypothetical protein
MWLFSGVAMALGIHGGGLGFACEHSVSSAAAFAGAGIANSHGAKMTPRLAMSLVLGILSSLFFRHSGRIANYNLYGTFMARFFLFPSANPRG